jgi:hypothetical protein
MILDDFVMLGKTVPEANSDGREFVCTAGFSIELGLPVRIYPMARGHCPKRWSVCRVPVERNPKDTRLESWKIKGDRSPARHWNTNNVIGVVQDRLHPADQKKIVEALSVSSIKEANQRRLSLCIIQPREIPFLTFEPGESAQMAPTPDLFDYLPALPVKQRFENHPRLIFHDEDGEHDLMLRDWGCYELMRKRPDRTTSVSYLEEALNLSTAPPLFCGNLNRFRNSWLVISVFSGTVHARPHVFDQQSLFPDVMSGTEPRLLG